MKIRAAVLEEFGRPLAVKEVDLAEPRAGEVLVRLAACGVCHTDMYTASGADPSGYAPAVLGHEGAGVVEKVGDEVGSLARDGEDIRHFMGCSTFAEYTVMPEIALAKVSPEAPFEHAALFACGLSTGLGAAINTAAVQAGTTCVVFGAGMVGLGAVAGCRLQGAERIICVDMSEDRLELAKGQGATDTMLGGPDAVREILVMTDGEYGADYTFEATGNVKVMQQALEATRMAWGLCTVAGVAGKGETLDVVPRLNRDFELMEAQDGIRAVIEFGW